MLRGWGKGLIQTDLGGFDNSIIPPVFKAKTPKYNSHTKNVLTILTFNGWGVEYTLGGVEKKYNRHPAHSGAKYKTSFWRWFSGAPGGVKHVRVNSVDGKVKKILAWLKPNSNLEIKRAREDRDAIEFDSKYLNSQTDCNADTYPF